MPHFISSIQVLPPSTIQLIRQKNCLVPLHELVEINVSYWGFDHKAHQGILIVNNELAAGLVTIFHSLYLHKFPIQRMDSMEQFNWDDDLAMAANNTSTFNCREVKGQPGIFSQHSYGRAIDINPLMNPYVNGEDVWPITGKEFADRTQLVPGKITKNSLVYKAFIKQGWDWGGDWLDVQDYQHFEKRAHGEKRNIHGYPKHN